MSVTFKLKDRISFSTKATIDEQVWLGTVATVEMAYSVASKLEPNIVQFHESAKRVDNTLPDSPAELNYFILSVEKDGVFSEKIFAKEWISEGTLNILELENVIDIRVHGVPNTELQNILDLLNSNNYTATKK